MIKIIRPTEIGKHIFSKTLRNVETKDGNVDIDEALIKLKRNPIINNKDLKNSINKSADGKTIERKKLRNIYLSNFSYNMALKIKEDYKDYYAIWQPSVSKVKRYEHVALYGKRFKIGKGIKGEFPCLRYGCKCGLLILGGMYLKLLAALIGIAAAMKETKQEYNEVKKYDFELTEYIDLLDGTYEVYFTYYLKEKDMKEKKSSIIVKKTFFIDNKYVNIYKLGELEIFCEEAIKHPNVEIIKIGGIYL